MAFNRHEVNRRIRTVLPERYWDTVIEDAIRHLGVHKFSTSHDTRMAAYERYVACLAIMRDTHVRVVGRYATELGLYTRVNQ